MSTFNQNNLSQKELNSFIEENCVFYGLTEEDAHHGMVIAIEMMSLVSCGFMKAENCLLQEKLTTVEECNRRAWIMTCCLFLVIKGSS